MSRIAVGMMFIAGILTCSAPAYASPIAFDCDVPPDHFSSISQDVVGPLAINGAVQTVEMRSGKYLPVAGARLVSLDGNNSVGFQLAAESTDAKRFDVILSLKRGNDLKQSTVAQIRSDSSVTFNLSLDDSGKVTLVIGNDVFNASFIPMSGGKEMAFCSTGQFKFANVSFSQSDHLAPANTQ